MTVQNKLKIRQDASSIQNNMYNYRTDQNQVVLYSLFNEIDALKSKIDFQDTKNDDIRAEIAFIKDQIRKREEKECVALSLDVSIKSDQATQYRSDVQSLRYELAHQSEEKERDEQELRRLKESVALRDIECRDQAAKLQTLEFQLQSSKANEENITRQANQKDLDLRHVTDELHHSTNEFAQVKDDNARLIIESQSLQRSLDQKLAEKADLLNR